MSRPRRIASGIATAVITHQPFSAGQEQQSLHITITMPSNKLRQLTSGGHNVTKGRTVSGNGRDQFVAGKRARVVKKSYVLESDSDEEDDEEDDEMEDVGDDDAEEESIDDEEDVEEDAEGDVDMDIPPPAPTIKISKPNNSKPVISVKPTGKSDGRTVEQKEASDDELSELESELGEEGMQLGDEDDAEGDEEEIEVEDDEDDDLDSDDETPGDGSRASTPDLTKLTKRQRARLEEGGSGHLLALPDGMHFLAKMVSMLIRYRGSDEETPDR
jgi:Ino eighty subunit 2